MIYKKYFLMIGLLVSGCASTSKIPTVNENEAFKYERKYLAEYEQLKNNMPEQLIVKWIQPTNKKTACKIYFSGFSIENQFFDDNNKVYWDGDCKNGYANGLGREFVKGTILDIESLAIYQGKQEEPQYFVQKDRLDNRTKEGDLNNGYYVETTIINDRLNFNITYNYGFFGSLKAPYQLITFNSPFTKFTRYLKNYPNFSYSLYDTSNDEFDSRKYQFDTLYHGQTPNGFGFTTPKIGATASGETNNGSIVRRVILPNSYFQKIAQIQSEIKNAGQKAINAQQYALKVKKQYLSKICKDSVSVDFINNDEYKDMCNEGDYYADLQKKIDIKLAQINQLNKQKREQLNQQKLINTQVSQANAAQRQANAATRSASAAERANSMQSWQNITNNSQMQQLNNHLMFMRMGL